MNSLLDQLKRLVEGSLESEGYEFVDLVVRGSMSSRVIQLFVDKVGGVTAKDCARISQKISDLFDFESENLKIGSYRLEVSSPGVDRPLRGEKDFKTNVERDAFISFYKNGVKKRIEGTIISTDTDSVFIRNKKNTVRVLYSSIQEARIKLKW